MMLTWFSVLCGIVLTSEVIVVFFSICILFHLAAEFNLCERSIFCHHFAVGNNKTVRDKFRMFVELVLVSFILYPALALKIFRGETSCALHARDFACAVSIFGQIFSL